MKLAEKALTFQPEQTLNIADLDKFSVDMEVETAQGTNQEGKEFTYEYIMLNGIKYRLPNPVLEQVKKILELRPDAKWFKAKKTGQGVATKYDVTIVQ